MPQAAWRVRRKQQASRKTGSAGPRTSPGAVAGASRAELHANSVLVVGLPFGVRPGVVRAGLREALLAFGVRRLRVCTTFTGHCRGYAVADLDRFEEALADQTLSSRFSIFKEGVEVATDVRLSACVGGKVDDFFPFVPSELRRQIQLDSVAMHSTMDEALGRQMATALKDIFLAAGGVPASAEAIDGCACCGGSALTLAQVFGGPFTAVEVDPVRGRMLADNISLLCSSQGRTVVGEFNELWPTLAPTDVIFLDPPWGGPEYGEQSLIQHLFLGPKRVGDLLVKMAAVEAASLYVLRLPHNHDLDYLASHLTEAWRDWNYVWDESLNQPEKPMPFRLSLGSCGWIFIVCACLLKGSVGRRNRKTSNWGGFRLAHLDSIVEALRYWDGENGSRHHVAFYDWEVRRWIPLSRWKGCKAGLRECKTPVAAISPDRLEEVAVVKYYQKLRHHPLG